MLTRPALLIRLEAAAILVVTLVAYHHLQASAGWFRFAILFLTPDLFMLGYLANPRFGSALYNLGHTVWVPLLLALYAWNAEREATLAVALIWISHIAFDRVLGYGLKYPTYFKDTHLQHLNEPIG
ncbi:protein of unknown function [Granulicella pectinivorans]|jgi:hypothetical protein|uniref:DUF4260 family protein n=1 Tax=Granulicella pectinivorans TaxID=474950 RepID=A0A1I6M4W4_9BACT|nr:DUF4260 domain-containing protein [Granulicella pectinivorans]SFS10668.1 protein of unknown function [Granulicella pectinivorans]